MKQAMIFAAGLGTRLKPLTDTMPKALVRVGGQPLLWHVIMKLKAAGYERIVVNVHHFAGQIVDYLAANRNFGLDIRISDESDLLLETGGGIRKARPLFDPSSPVLIHNVDILTSGSQGDCPPVLPDRTGGQSPCDPSPCDPEVTTLAVSERETKRYLQFDEGMRLVGWKNVETGEVRGREGRSLAFSGIHVITPELLRLMDEWPERFPIMDFYLKVCDQVPVYGYEAKGLQLLDVGKLDTLEQAEAFVRQIDV